MLAGDFINLCWASSRTIGTPYLTLTGDPGAFRDLIQECLQVYTSETQCLQGLNVAFTPVIGQQSYDTFTVPNIQGATTIPSYLTAALCDVRQVMINGAFLQVLSDEGSEPFTPVLGGPTASRFGESDNRRVMQNFPTYLTAANGTPVAFWQESPNKLWFNCPFDVVYPNCFLSGRLYHDPLLSDQQVLQLAPEDVRPAMRYCCARLIEVNDPDKGLPMLQAAEAQMKDRKASCNRKSGGLPTRGTGNPRRIVDLAR